MDRAKISPEQLLHLIGRADCPYLIDLTVDADFDADPYLIPGAFRHAHTDLDGLMRRIGGVRNAETPAILICQKGGKLSQGAAAWLKSGGLDARFLEGGNMGWCALGNAPRIRARSLPDHKGGGSLWACEEDAGPDRLLASWIIRRFVDRSARCLYVEPGTGQDVCAKFGAQLFGHQAGGVKGLCRLIGLNPQPFDGLIAAFLRQDPIRRGIDALCPDAVSEARFGHPLLDTFYAGLGHDAGVAAP